MKITKIALLLLILLSCTLVSTTKPGLEDLLIGNWKFESVSCTFENFKSVKKLKPNQRGIVLNADKSAIWREEVSFFSKKMVSYPGTWNIAGDSSFTIRYTKDSADESYTYKVLGIHKKVLFTEIISGQF